MIYLHDKLDNLFYTCLSVGEDTGVISLEGVIQDVMPKALEDLFLSGERRVSGIHRIEAMIKSKVLRLSPAVSKI